jgi:hypothetical protein
MTADPAGSTDAQCSSCDPGRLNTAASFSAQAEPYTRPCLTIACVHVFAYVDGEGCLTVSVDLDESRLRYGPSPDSPTPLRVRVGVDEVLPQGLAGGRLHLHVPAIRVRVGCALALGRGLSRPGHRGDRPGVSGWGRDYLTPGTASEVEQAPEV